MYKNPFAIKQIKAGSPRCEHLLAKDSKTTPSWKDKCYQMNVGDFSESRNEEGVAINATPSS